MIFEGPWLVHQYPPIAVSIRNSKKWARAMMIWWTVGRYVSSQTVSSLIRVKLLQSSRVFFEYCFRCLFSCILYFWHIVSRATIYQLSTCFFSYFLAHFQERIFGEARRPFPFIFESLRIRDNCYSQQKNWVFYFKILPTSSYLLFIPSSTNLISYESSIRRPRLLHHSSASLTARWKAIQAEPCESWLYLC